MRRGASERSREHFALRRLPTPTSDPNNATSGDFTPAWNWSNVTGASGYTFAMDGPDGQHQEWPSLRMPAAAFVYLFGPGIWHWRVRAEFPKEGFGNVPGPYSAPVAYTRTLGEPGGATVDSAPDHVLFLWNAKLGVKEYRLEISSRPDFAYTMEDTRTENTSYAPTLTDSAWGSGKPIYWRVAGVDEDGNQGDFSPIQQVSLLPRMHLVASGKLRPACRARSCMPSAVFIMASTQRRIPSRLRKLWRSCALCLRDSRISIW